MKSPTERYHEVEHFVNTGQLNNKRVNCAELESESVLVYHRRMKNEQHNPQFVPGLKLAEGFFHEEVLPILKAHYPSLQYSAALIGSGSEILGFDTDMSADHHWGPRTVLFLCPDSLSAIKK